MKKLTEVTKNNDKVSKLVMAARINLVKCYGEIDKDQPMVVDFINSVSSLIDKIYTEHQQKIEDSICSGFESVYGEGAKFNGTTHRLKGSIKATYDYLVKNYSPVMDECFKETKDVETKLTTVQCGKCFVFAFIQKLLQDTPEDVVVKEDNSKTFDKSKLIEEATTKSEEVLKGEVIADEKNEIVASNELPDEEKQTDKLVDDIYSVIVDAVMNNESTIKLIVDKLVAYIPIEIVNVFSQNNINLVSLINEAMMDPELKSLVSLDKIKDITKFDKEFCCSIYVPLINFLKRYCDDNHITKFKSGDIQLDIDSILRFIKAAGDIKFDEAKVKELDEYKKILQMFSSNDTNTKSTNIIQKRKEEFIISKEKLDLEPVNLSKMILANKVSKEVEEKGQELEEFFKKNNCQDILDKLVEGFNLSLDELAYVLMVDNSLTRIRSYIVNTMIRQFINTSERKEALRKSIVDNFLVRKCKPIANLTEDLSGFYRFYNIA